MLTKKSFFQFKLMLLAFAGIILFLPVLKSQASTVWQVTGSKGVVSTGAGYETDITTSDQGIVYTAFQDKKFGKKARVRKFNGSSWSDLADADNPRGLVSAREGYKPALAAKGNSVYIAFSDQSQNYRVKVKKWDGVNWTDLSDNNHPLGLISSQKGEEPEIQLNKSGSLLYVAFRDELSGSRIKVMQWNGTGWAEVSDENNPSGLISSAGGAEVAIVSSKIDDSLYLTYEDVSNNLRLVVKKFDGSHWSTVTDSTHSDGLITTTPAYSPSISVDSNDHLYLVYTYKKEGDTRILHWDGSSWNTLGNGIVSSGKTIESTVEVDSQNNVLVAMSQYKKVGKRKASWGIKVKKWDGQLWKDVSDSRTPQGFLSRKGKGDPSLTSFGGKIYISFTDYGMSRKARIMFFNPTGI